MEWIEGISSTIDYIESHITEKLTIEEIARQAYISPFYFQKGFAMLCGFTVGDYIRQRRLTLAGSELLAPRIKLSTSPSSTSTIRQIVSPKPSPVFMGSPQPLPVKRAVC